MWQAICFANVSAFLFLISVYLGRERVQKERSDEGMLAMLLLLLLAFPWMSDSDIICSANKSVVNKVTTSVHNHP